MAEGGWGIIMVLITLAIGGFVGYTINECLKSSENPVQSGENVVSLPGIKKKKKKWSRSKSKSKSKSTSKSKKKRKRKMKKKGKSRSKDRKERKKEKRQKSKERKALAKQEPLNPPRNVPVSNQDNGAQIPYQPKNQENMQLQPNVVPPEQNMQPFQKAQPQ